MYNVGALSKGSVFNGASDSYTCMIAQSNQSVFPCNKARDVQKIPDLSADVAPSLFPPATLAFGIQEGIGGCAALTSAILWDVQLSSAPKSQAPASYKSYPWEVDTDHGWWALGTDQIPATQATAFQLR